jgi:hypothetical protein
MMDPESEILIRDHRLPGSLQGVIRQRRFVACSAYPIATRTTVFTFGEQVIVKI